ncbi:MAG TPA: ABC transporter substrate-binding protein [Caulobacteraceae bacterium]
MRAIAMIAAAALTLGEAAEAAPRVMSLDQCSDQYVLALSPRETIVGVSPRVDDRDSYLRAKAAGLPQRRATAEAVLAARPDVVVRYWGGDARLSETLERRGVRVVRIEEAEDFAGVRDNVRRVAGALDQREAGERIVARMDAQLAAAHGAWRGQRALYLTPSGFTAGQGTLIEAVLAAAGLRGAAERPGFAAVSLERLVLDPPGALVLGFFDAFARAMERWGPGRHRVLTQLVETKTVGSLPGAIAGCPGWFAAEGALKLAKAAPR